MKDANLFTPDGISGVVIICSTLEAEAVEFQQPLS